MANSDDHTKRDSNHNAGQKPMERFYVVSEPRDFQIWLIVTIILAAVAIISTMVILEEKRKFDLRYPGCWQLFGEDLECKAAWARRRMRGY